MRLIKKIAKNILPKITHDLFINCCEMRGDKASQKIDSRIKPATNKDYFTEYLDKIISYQNVKQKGAIYGIWLQSVTCHRHFSGRT